MPRPVEVKALPGFRLWLRYEDGVEGEIDVSDLAGRGVFTAWADEVFFQSVHIAPHGAIAWGDDIELCAEAMYLRLTGKRPSELFRTHGKTEVDA